MLSFPDAFPALIPATADEDEVELLTYKRWYHGSLTVMLLISVTFRPRTTPLTGPQRVHELMFSELPCFSVTFNGRYLARILVYVSHTKHTCLGC